MVYSPDSNTWLTGPELHKPLTTVGHLALRRHIVQVLLVGGDKDGAPVGEYTPRVPDTQRYTR